MKKNQSIKTTMDGSDKPLPSRAASFWSTVFLLTFLSLGLWTLFSKNRDFSAVERRPLAQRPSLSFSKISDGAYQSDFAAYLSDQFPLRSQALALKAEFQKAIGKFDNSRVYFGKNNALIEKRTDLDWSKLDRNLQDMDAFSEMFLKQRPEARISYLIAPTQAGVYPERLPYGAVESNQAEGMVALRSKHQKKGLIYPDLLEGLRKSEKDDLYFRTDHHWTQQGALEAYKLYKTSLGEVESLNRNLDKIGQAEMMTQDFHGTTYQKAPAKSIRADRLDAFVWPGLDSAQLYDGQGNAIGQGLYCPEALASTDAYEYFLGPNRDIVEIKMGNEDKDRGTLLLIKDSYANAFVPFLTMDYKRIIVLDLRYLKDPIADILDRYAPDDLMFLYNIGTFSEENSSYKLLD
jgi:hypothetical protein